MKLIIDIVSDKNKHLEFLQELKGKYDERLKIKNQFQNKISQMVSVLSLTLKKLNIFQSCIY
jgi:hypothetical protein